MLSASAFLWKRFLEDMTLALYKKIYKFCKNMRARVA